MNARLTLLAAVALLVGCGPKVNTTRFADYPPRPDDHPVQVFAEQRPECPYDEVARIEVTKKYYVQSMDTVVEQLRTEARKVGADALVGTGSAERSEGGMAVPTEYGWLYGDMAMEGVQALAIRFSDPECTD